MTTTQSMIGAEVGYQDVRDYLRSRGWVSGPSKRDYAAIYRSPEGQNIEVVVPLDRDLGDYGIAMARVAERVAQYEQRDSEAVLRDLTQPRVDTLRFALEGNKTSTGSVSLTDGEAMIRGARKALLASACSVERPRKHHPRMSLMDADKFLDGCSLGQTEHGSFVLTVGAPLEIGHEPTKTPFGRQTTEYLLRAVDLLAGAIRRGELEPVFNPRADQPIVSSNLCDALVDMLPSNETADLRLRSSWSPLLPTPHVRPEVLVDRTMFEPLVKIRGQLRPQASSKTAAFLGYVVELAGEESAAGQMEGDVTLSLHTPDDPEAVKARVILGPDEYRTAWDAHYNRRAIHVRGILRRGGRVNQLDEPSEFKTV